MQGGHHHDQTQRFSCTCSSVVPIQVSGIGGSGRKDALLVPASGYGDGGQANAAICHPVQVAVALVETAAPRVFSVACPTCLTSAPLPRQLFEIMAWEGLPDQAMVSRLQRRTMLWRPRRARITCTTYARSLPSGTLHLAASSTSALGSRSTPIVLCVPSSVHNLKLPCAVSAACLHSQRSSAKVSRHHTLAGEHWEADRYIADGALT